MTTTRRSRSKLPYWVRGDTNAFFGFGVNVLVNVLTLTGAVPRRHQHAGRRRLRRRSCRRSASRWCSATSTTRYLARRLARRENRTDVTAMPYGPSVPHMFIVIFVIMLPIYLRTKDPIAGLDRPVSRGRSSSA